MKISYLSIALSLAAAVVQPVRASLVKVSFDGAFTSGSSFLLSDAPFSLADAVSGYLVYDADAPVTGTQPVDRPIYEGAVKFLSFTFDGLGTVTWDPARVSPGRLIPPYNEATVYPNLSGSEPSFIARDERMYLFTDSAWDGSPDLLSFPLFGSPGNPEWQLVQVNVSFVTSDVLAFGELPGAGSPFLMPGEFFVDYDYPGGGARALGSLTSLRLEAVPEPSTLTYSLAAFVFLLKRFRRRFSARRA